ncbi:uncharacterized protein F4812DRAFT_415468 [Daldinia caldariorum]|uniref:uncharacterized protein n=1 Tax=Daldinia caldariorum TaxID=326644 RepID=UPI0020072AA5|nr:uncharacterized protein F4812DRAFT_415468 [Daldinia caldariorum]KAI1471788.1 hypothetical protein F4812DRAFT_415468 [Daldinia caldariorum]
MSRCSSIAKRITRLWPRFWAMLMILCLRCSFVFLLTLVFPKIPVSVLASGHCPIISLATRCNLLNQENQELSLCQVPNVCTLRATTWRLCTWKMV